MDSICKQLESAIIYAQDVDSAPASVERKNASITFINNMRGDPSSWKIALSTFQGTTDVMRADSASFIVSGDVHVSGPHHFLHPRGLLRVAPRRGQELDPQDALRLDLQQGARGHQRRPRVSQEEIRRPLRPPHQGGLPAVMARRVRGSPLFPSVT